jgi:hypothetical protein
VWQAAPRDFYSVSRQTGELKHRHSSHLHAAGALLDDESTTKDQGSRHWVPTPAGIEYSVKYPLNSENV